MAHIGPYKDGYRVQLQRDGVRVSKVFRLKRDAIAWANDMETRKTPLRGKSLRDACDHYLKTVSPQKRDAVKWERRRFESLQEFFGDIALADIDSEKLGLWRDWRLAGDDDHKPVSGSTVVREVNLYRNLFMLAHKEWKWISVYPFDGVRLPKESEPRSAIWRSHEIWRILKAGKRSGGKTLEVAQAFHISLRTAMRLKEALAAPGCFDPQRRVCDLPPTKTAPRGEKVPLTKEGVRLLLKMPKFEVDANEASVLFSKLCKENLITGLQFRDARATALTHMSRKMDILTLSRISRHKDLDLLRSTYYRESAEDIAKRL